MRNEQKIAVVIPTLNEEQAIASVLRDIPGWVDTVIVADNGSNDDTQTIARVHGAVVVVEPERGYGAACHKGIAALDTPDIIVFLDGDYSDHPQDMHLLVDPITNGLADLVIGSRIEASRNTGALTLHQRFGNWLACRLIRQLFGVSYTDLGPFRAIRAEALTNLNMQDRAYGWTVEMQIRAARQGLLIQEVPVRYRPRIGVSKISGTIRGSIRAGTTILRIIGRAALQPQ